MMASTTTTTTTTRARASANTRAQANQHAQSRASCTRATPVRSTRRVAIVSTPIVALTTGLVSAPFAFAEEDPKEVKTFLGFSTTVKPTIEEYEDDTRKLISQANALLSGDDVSPEAQATFEQDSERWLGRYKFNHGKHLESYSDVFNVQAKLSVQFISDRSKGVAYDPEHTIFNRSALIKRLAKGAKALEMGE